MMLNDLAIPGDGDGDWQPTDKVLSAIRAFTERYPNSEFGPAHCVLSDYNIDDATLTNTLAFYDRAAEKQFREDGYHIVPGMAAEHEAVKAFLRELLSWPDADKFIVCPLCGRDLTGYYDNGQTTWTCRKHGPVTPAGD